VTPPLYIARRFLSNRKRSFFLSLGGVVFGVAIFICTQAQTQGFAKNFIDSTLGSNGALVMKERVQTLEGAAELSPLPVHPPHRRLFQGINNAAEIMRVSRRFANVVACSPVLRGNLTVRAGFQSATVDLFGIDLPLHLQTTNLAKQIETGSLEDFRNNPSSVILGAKLANALLVSPGESVQLLSPDGEYRRFVVAATARSGVGVVDAARVYCHAKVAQSLLHKPYSTSMIIYKLRDPNRAPALAARFETLFGHEMESWQDREEGNLQLFLTIRLSAAITVSLIILLAGFGIFNVLTMTVLSKLKEIAILRSIGYRRGDISAIFLWQGGMIAVAGSLVGCVAGALLTSAVAHIPIRVRGLIFANHFLVAWDWRHYFWGTLLALVAVAIASYVPARRAGLLSPVSTLRGTSG
jgi:lipoprotein-releasing system permease protein